MNQLEEGDLAWDLVERSRADLTVAQLNTIFVKLALNEYHSVIRSLLKAVVRQGVPLETAWVSRLCAWMDGYHGDPELAALRKFLRC